MAQRKIGLLGGSFNPPHDGHKHISLMALRRLQLDEVWWIVSPQNPLKSRQGMADINQRLAKAEIVSKHPCIRVSDIERKLGTQYTIDTMLKLQRSKRNVKYVWLMGADNLVQFPTWLRWQEIAAILPIAVFDRGNNAFRAISGKMASRYKYRRIKNPSALATATPPAWCFLFTPQHAASSTILRHPI